MRCVKRAWLAEQWPKWLRIHSWAESMLLWPISESPRSRRAQARWSRIPCPVLGPPISTSRTRSAPPGSFVYPFLHPREVARTWNCPSGHVWPALLPGTPAPSFPHPGNEHSNALLAQPGLAGELRWGPVQPPQGRKSADMAFVREPPCTCHSHYSFGAGQWSPQNWSQTQRNDLL